MRLEDSYYEMDFIAKLTGYAEKTIRNKASAGSELIPPSVKLGRNLVFPKPSTLEWAKRRGLPLG